MVVAATAVEEKSVPPGAKGIRSVEHLCGALKLQWH